MLKSISLWLYEEEPHDETFLVLPSILALAYHNSYFSYRSDLFYFYVSCLWHKVHRLSRDCHSLVCYSLSWNVTGVIIEVRKFYERGDVSNCSQSLDRWHCGWLFSLRRVLVSSRNAL